MFQGVAEAATTGVSEESSLMSPVADKPKAAPAEVPAAENPTLQRMVRGWEMVRVVMVVRVKFLKDQGDLKLGLSENGVPQIARVYHLFPLYTTIKWGTVYCPNFRFAPPNQTVLCKFAQNSKNPQRALGPCTF